MPNEYAQALFRAQQTTADPHKTVEALVSLLKRSGKIKALPAILKAYERLEAQHHAHAPRIVLADESDAAMAQTKVRSLLGEKASQADMHINKTLIGGWRYEDKDTLVDASYKKVLLQLYRTITT